MKTTAYAVQSNDILRCVMGASALDAAGRALKAHMEDDTKPAPQAPGEWMQVVALDEPYLETQLILTTKAAAQAGLKTEAFTSED